MVTLLYQTLQLTLGYHTVIRRTSIMAAGTNFAFKIAAKLLQIETCYYQQPMETRHRPIQRYHCRTVTMYRLARIHALQTNTTTDRETTYAQRSTQWSAKNQPVCAVCQSAKHILMDCSNLRCLHSDVTEQSSLIGQFSIQFRSVTSLCTRL